MGVKLVYESDLTDIADAIRGKTGGSTPIPFPDFASEITDIPSGGSDHSLAHLIDKTITSEELNGRTDVTAVGGSSIANCTALTTVDLPNVTSILQQAFASCTSLKSVRFLSLSTAVQAFRLTGSNFFFADLGQIGTLNTLMFQGDTGLRTLILRKTDGVTTLASRDVLSGTVFATNISQAVVYVPQSKISQYQQETNWATYYADNNNLFQPLEGSPYESTDYVLPTS